MNCDFYRDLLSNRFPLRTVLGTSSAGTRRGVAAHRQTHGVPCFPKPHEDSFSSSQSSRSALTDSLALADLRAVSGVELTPAGASSWMSPQASQHVPYLCPLRCFLLHCAVLSCIVHLQPCCHFVFRHGPSPSMRSLSQPFMSGQPAVTRDLYVNLPGCVLFVMFLTHKPSRLLSAHFYESISFSVVSTSRLTGEL